MPFHIPVRIAALLLAALLLGGRAAADNVCFIKFFRSNTANITQGSSRDPQFNGSEGWTQLQSLDMTALRETAFINGVTLGQPELKPFLLRKAVDIVSPPLYSNLATGSHFETVVVVITEQIPKPLTRPRPFLAVKLLLVYPTEIHWRAVQSNAPPAEAVSLVVGGVRATWNEVDETGHLISTTPTALSVVSESVLDRFVLPPPSLQYHNAAMVTTGGAGSFLPVIGPSGPIPVNTIEIQSSSSYTGGIQVDPDSGVVEVDHAAPEGGPHRLVIRASDLFGQVTDAALDLYVGAPRLTAVAQGNEVMLLELLGRPNTLYTIQSAGDPTGPWADEPGARISDNAGEALFQVATTSAARFFRARE